MRKEIVVKSMDDDTVFAKMSKFYRDNFEDIKRHSIINPLNEFIFDYDTEGLDVMHLYFAFLDSTHFYYNTTTKDVQKFINFIEKRVYKQYRFYYQLFPIMGVHPLYKCNGKLIKN